LHALDDAVRFGVSPNQQVRGAPMTDMKSLVIGALLVAVVVLGYLYWDRQRNTVEIKLPSVTIEKR
jgi:predicted negative regulator of RcsB-dependent stress response